jgi:hypothetical protein
LIGHGIVCVLVCSGPDRLVVGRFFITELVYCGLTMRSRYCDECSMVITTIINDTTQVFRIIEGNAGVYSTYGQLDPGQTISMKYPSNATYLEYSFIDEAHEEVRITLMDEFLDCMMITLYVTHNGSLACRGAPRVLGAVYTMDHEVVPRKRPILRGTTSWDDFHGPSY